MKKILLSLLVCVVGFIGFSNAWSLYISSDWSSYNPWSYTFDVPLSSLSIKDFLCLDDNCSLQLQYEIDWWYSTCWIYYWNWDFNNYCGDYIWTVNFINEREWESFYDHITLNFDSLWSGDCPVVDTNYCVENDLCPVPDNFSQLFINDLEFQSHPVINIEIPDYITWDYTWTESWFNLYVWSWYDVDYINSIIDINSYRPTSQDFTYMFVSGLTLIFPYIFVALLIVFMWKLIKRIFK